MANIDRTFVGGAAAVNLSGTMTPTLPAPGGTFTVTGDVSSWPSTNFAIQVNTEKMFCSARSAATFTIGAGGRGFDGTPATNHSNNAPIIHLLDAAVMTAIVAHVNDTTLDHHTQYLRSLGTDGAGLSVNNRVLAVNTDNLGIEVATDALRLKDLGVVTAKLADGSVTTPKLGANAVTNPKVADDAVTTTKILDAAVINAKLAAMPATTVKGVTTAGAPTDLTFATLTPLLGPYPRVFATTASRDTAIPSPTEGMMCVTTDSGSIWQYQSGMWFRPFSVLHYQSFTGTVNGIGVGGYDLPVSPSIAIPGNRRLAMRAQIPITGGPGGCFTFAKMDGVVKSPHLSQWNDVPASGCVLAGECHFGVNAGNHTFTLGTSGVTGTFNLVAGSDPAWYEVRDLGPT
jgi:hypothetical protein